MPSGPYKTITIPDATHQLLLRMAKQNHRTMAGQLIHMLEEVQKSVDTQSS